MKVKIINHYGVILTIKKMENEEDFSVALGAYIGELQKRAHLTNKNVYGGTGIGHSTYGRLKKG